MLVETDRSVRAGVPESTRWWWASQGLQRSALSPRAMSPSAPRGDTARATHVGSEGRGGERDSRFQCHPGCATKAITGGSAAEPQP